MEPKNLIAKTHTTINTSIDKVWDAFVNPDTIKKYMFDTTVISDWKEGSKITWKGEWNGKPYEDKGTILQFKPTTKLQYNHFSPLTGQPDVPENYHTVTVELADTRLAGATGQEGTQTIVTLSQDKNATEQEKEHSEQNWMMMLSALKKLLEENNGQ